MSLASGVRGSEGGPRAGAVARPPGGPFASWPGSWPSPRVAVVILLALGVLGGVILLGRQHLESRLREQITRRDAEILYAVALMHQHSSSDDGGDREDEELDHFNLMLEVSRLKGVIAVRLYDEGGRCLDVFPAYVSDGPKLPDHALRSLKDLRPVSYFHESVSMETVLVDGQKHDSAPLLEVLVPLHASGTNALSAVGQFVIEGRTVAAEFATLSRTLSLQAFFAFALSGAILVGGLGLAFRRLEKTNTLLKARTASLVKANEELVLAAKTSAVGSVTSHLLHGLKNPLAGLQDFVSSRGEGDDQTLRWEQAEAAARRMREMIYDILNLLREDEGIDACELSMEDVGALVVAKVRELARASNVRVDTCIHSKHAIPVRVAQLSSLILVNLIQNGIEATPQGGAVRLEIKDTDEGLAFCVADQGAGVPEHLVEKLFSPLRSSKNTGSGVGLALCNQIAKHIGANLRLACNTRTGCVFELELPQTVFSPAFNR